MYSRHWVVRGTWVSGGGELGTWCSVAYKMGWATGYTVLRGIGGGDLVKGAQWHSKGAKVHGAVA